MLEALFWALYLAMFLTGAINFHIGPVSVFVNTVLLALFTPLALMKFALRRTIALPAWVWLAILACLASLCISLFVNLGLTALAQLVQLLIFLTAMMTTVFCVPRRPDLRKWFIATTLGCGINAAVGIAQSAAWIVKHGLVFIADGQWFRISGLFASPVDYVTILMIGLAMSGAVPRRGWRVLLQLTYCALLMLSMSRSGIIVVGIAGTLALVNLMRGRASIFLKAGAVTALLLGVAALSSVQLIVSRVADIGNANFNNARLLTFQDALRQSTQSATYFLFGHGLGSYEFYNPAAQEMFNNTHNIYLFFLYCTGVVGLVVFTILVAGLIAECRRLQRTSDGSWMSRELPAAVLMLHLFVWVEALVETNILGVGSGWLIGAIFGLPLAIRQLAATE